jgi:GNAT superfamily N-acetyltransferase
MIRSEATAIVQPLEWDSRHFGFAVLHVDAASPRALHDATARCRALGARVAYLQLAVDDLPMLDAATSLGFRLVDTRVEYEADETFTPWPAPDAIDALRAPSEHELEEVEELARRAAFPSRFLRDEGFPREQAHDLYAQWVRAASRRQLSDLVVGFAAGRPVGLATIRSGSDDVGLQELLVVDPAHQGRGLGRALLSATVSTLLTRGHVRVVIATQLANSAAIRSLERVGYRLASARHTLHRWFD